MKNLFIGVFILFSASGISQEDISLNQLGNDFTQVRNYLLFNSKVSSMNTTSMGDSTDILDCQIMLGTSLHKVVFFFSTKTSKCFLYSIYSPLSELETDIKVLDTYYPRIEKDKMMWSNGKILISINMKGSLYITSSLDDRFK